MKNTLEEQNFFVLPGYSIPRPTEIRSRFSVLMLFQFLAVHHQPALGQDEP